MAANVEQQLATLLFWGGDLTKNGDMGSVDYSEPPKTMCFMSHSSSYDELETKVHAAMDTNADKTRLVLFGRHPMVIPGGQTVFVPIPLTNDQSWKWFLQVASVSQPIHVYAIAKRRTDGQLRGQEAPLLSHGTYPRDYGLSCETYPREYCDEYSSEWVSGLCSQIFNKAVMVPDFSEMFADIFYRLWCMLPEFCVDNERVNFKRLLLNCCQREFERSEADREFASDQEKVIHIRRKRGNIKLIGELYKKKMLPEKIIHHCIQELLGEYENPVEEDIEALCHLMHTVGETIDIDPKAFILDMYFKRISELINHPTLSSRLKEMLVHLAGLRENKWQKIGEVTRLPKIFEDFHPSS